MKLTNENTNGVFKIDLNPELLEKITHGILLQRSVVFRFNSIPQLEFYSYLEQALRSLNVNIDDISLQFLKLFPDLGSTLHVKFPFKDFKFKLTTHFDRSNKSHRYYIKESEFDLKLNESQILGIYIVEETNNTAQVEVKRLKKTDQGHTIKFGSLIKSYTVFLLTEADIES